MNGLYKFHVGHGGKYIFHTWNIRVTVRPLQNGGFPRRCGFLLFFFSAYEIRVELLNCFCEGKICGENDVKIRKDLNKNSKKSWKPQNDTKWRRRTLEKRIEWFWVCSERFGLAVLWDSWIKTRLVFLSFLSAPCLIQLQVNCTNRQLRNNFNFMHFVRYHWYHCPPPNSVEWSSTPSDILKTWSDEHHGAPVSLSRPGSVWSNPFAIEVMKGRPRLTCKFVAPKREGSAAQHDQPYQPEIWKAEATFRCQFVLGDPLN